MNNMEKIKITQIGEVKTFQGKDGTFDVFSIKTEQGWLSGYYNNETKLWKVGDEREVVITEKEKNGKTYKNFNLPKKEDVKLAQLEKNLEEKIVHKLESILIQLGQIRRHLNIPATTPGNKEEEEKGYHYPTPEDEGIKVEKEVEYPEEDTVDVS